MLDGVLSFKRLPFAFISRCLTMLVRSMRFRIVPTRHAHLRYVDEKMPLMNSRVATLLILLVSFFVEVPVSVLANSTDVDFFESKVRPLLIEHCYECHSAQSGESNGNLRLDTSVASRRGGDRGPAVVPNDVDASLLIRAVSYADADMEMPPAGKIADDQIDVLKHWIASGAADPRDESPGDSPAKALPLDRDPQSHWAFIPPNFAPPIASPSPDANDLIDAAFTAAAATKGVVPSPTADRATLLRRLFFDLSGLVPSEAEVVGFANDPHPLAYQHRVDRLLAAPEFGERWARHWMDIARYADTVGYDFGAIDRRLVGSERFRDWCIASFGSDMPYDEMIRHQLSGDSTDPDNSHGNLDAMGYLTVGRKFIGNRDLIDDRIDVISRGLLGLTVACARCHDHKFDPIAAKDYYSLAGILLSSESVAGGASPLMLKDVAEPHDYPVLVRGQEGNDGENAPRQFLTALRKADEPRFTQGSGRVELAERIVASDNPLTYRVMVNRLWIQLTGVPLVDTPSDLGFRTPPPAVPEVLDDLAAEFATHKSIQKIIRRIVLSTSYQRSASAVADSLAMDPENRYAMRGQRRRKDFESLRDSMLVVSDTIQQTRGGAPIDITTLPPIPRRTVYAFIDRQFLPGVYRTFDVASPDIHSPGRYYTTVPQQGLFLLNNPFVITIASRVAEQVAQSLGATNVDETATADAMFVRVLGRHPTPDELQGASAFLQLPIDNPSGKEGSPPPLSRREQLAQLLIISNEFAFVD